MSIENISFFTNQMLYHNGDIEKINWLSVGFVGVSSYGMYYAMTYASYKWGGGKDWSYQGERITYGQYKTMQADFQRSRFWRKEYGGVLTNDGGVIRAEIDKRSSLKVDLGAAIQKATEPGGRGLLTHYHTHWAKGGITYNVDINYNISSDGPIPTITSDGPSSADLNFTVNNGNGYLIDRNNLYIYNDIRGLTFSNGGGMLRYFPIFNYSFISPIW